MTKSEAELIVEAILDRMAHSLRTGDKIEIRGFGSFRTRQRQSRIDRNPKTGAKVNVPAKKIAYFKPCKDLRDVVSGLPAGTPPESAFASERVPRSRCRDSSIEPSHSCRTRRPGTLRPLDVRRRLNRNRLSTSSRNPVHLTRHALTVAFVKPGRGSWPYQAMTLVQTPVVNPLGDRGRNASHIVTNEDTIVLADFANSTGEPVFDD
jgi:integration host factor subunit beta